MNTQILPLLHEIEEKHNVKILYACESGSRAWGFESPDSDFDVRFIYVHNKDWYLSIGEKRDVIELPVNEVLDISGWELRKALGLFRKSNAQIYEWLQSPIVYMKDEAFHAEMLSLATVYFSPKPGLNHYLSLARNVLETDLKSEEVKIKKYFYALRSTLAALWIVERNEVPPMEFSKLRVLIPNEEIQSELDELLEQKKLADEKTLITAIPFVTDFIAETLAYCYAEKDKLEDERKDVDALNDFFRKMIQ